MVERTDAVGGPGAGTGDVAGEVAGEELAGPRAAAGVAAVVALPPRRAVELLLGCCAAPRWAHRVVARRPHRTPQALLAAVAEELRAAPEADVDAALAAHPRIGERPAGADSRREQAGVLTAGADVLAALAEGNRAYEERFGHVYLVRASGRSAAELLALLRARLGNDPTTERAVLRGELLAITVLRLRRALDELAGVAA
ncbi:2-oxo-4-hydroxy-4-carboxy-5-ureidoimidazoline decarboxylase [Kineococcus glutinatus]|uniref:2-oxo-4-hydroxy-4-carboxy-5-ureidoimidazoline decarboxylase n=1 Tax=Kineococcus glutinatus TaxID=1070872 RepID=A0ABP9HWA2_9ACTN